MSDISFWSGPGLVLIYFHIVDPVKVTPQSLDEWWIAEARPQILASGAVTRVWSYKAANPEYDKQRVHICKVSDLALVHAGKLRAIPRSSQLGFFEGDFEAEDTVRYESRMYSLEQVYELSKHDEEFGPCLTIAMMEPSFGGETELDQWYRVEHNKQMSLQPGWKRTQHFRLVFQHGNEIKESKQMSFLAIHEFSEENELGIDVAPLEPMSDWTKKIMKEASAIDAAVYHRIPSP